MLTRGAARDPRPPLSGWLSPGGQDFHPSDARVGGELHLDQPVSEGGQPLPSVGREQEVAPVALPGSHAPQGDLLTRRSRREGFPPEEIADVAPGGSGGLVGALGDGFHVGRAALDVDARGGLLSAIADGADRERPDGQTGDLAEPPRDGEDPVKVPGVGEGAGGSGERGRY